MVLDRVNLTHACQLDPRLGIGKAEYPMIPDR